MNGRPENKRSSGSENRKRGRRMYARVTVGEHETVARDAAAHGFTVGSYLRWLALERPETRTVRRPLPSESLLAGLKGDAGRVNGNLAQFLKLANRGEIVQPHELGETMKAVREFYTVALELLKGGQ